MTNTRSAILLLQPSSLSLIVFFIFVLTFVSTFYFPDSNLLLVYGVQTFSPIQLGILVLNHVPFAIEKLFLFGVVLFFYSVVFTIEVQILEHYNYIFLSVFYGFWYDFKVFDPF